jgi:hypothetical protein
MAEVLRLAVTVPRGEALRYLGYPRARPPSPPVQRRVEALWLPTLSLLEPRGAFVLVSRAQALELGVPSPSELVALAACTIGPALEEHEARLSAAGDPLGALIVDSIGSAAAEAAAVALHAQVCASLQDRGQTAVRRMSPGYGRWDVARQSGLLALLPAEALGIRLTGGSMMVPRKSVSFAAMAGVDDVTLPRARCAACELTTCRYRHDGAEQEGATR